MKYTRFTKDNLAALRATVNRKLAELEAETGIKFQMTGISYQDLELTAKVEMKINSPEAKARMEADSNSFLIRYNLRVGDLLVQKGKTYRVESYNIASRKRPVVTTCLSDGKTTVWPGQLAMSCKH